MTLSLVMPFYIKSQRHNTRKKEGLNKNLLKLITSAPQKSVKRIRRWATSWEKIFVRDISVNRYPKTFKELLKLYNN